MPFDDGELTVRTGRFKFDQSFPGEAVAFQGLIALGVSEADLCGDAVDQGAISALCAHIWGTRPQNAPQWAIEAH